MNQKHALKLKAKQEEYEMRKDTAQTVLIQMASDHVRKVDLPRLYEQEKRDGELPNDLSYQDWFYDWLRDGTLRSLEATARFKFQPVVAKEFGIDMRALSI